MASASEIFKVVGSIVIEGQADAIRDIDSIGNKASSLANSLKTTLKNPAPIKVTLDGETAVTNSARNIGSAVDTLAGKLKTSPKLSVNVEGEPTVTSGVQRIGGAFDTLAGKLRATITGKVALDGVSKVEADLATVDRDASATDTKLRRQFKNVTVDDSLSKGVHREITNSGSDLDNFEKKSRLFATAVTGILALGTGAAIIAGKVLTVSGDFEQSLANIKAVSGATTEEMAQINKLALDIGKNTSLSASGAAEGIGELIKAGVSIKDVIGGAADAVVALASAGGISVADAATIASSAMNAFGLQAKDLGGVADLIAGAANASAIDVGQFGFSLQSVGAVANLAGVSFKDTATAIALMGNAGIVGSDAGTSLKSMLMNLQPTTKAAQKEFGALGLTTFDTAKAQEYLQKQGVNTAGMLEGDLADAFFNVLTKGEDFKDMTAAQQKDVMAAAKSIGVYSNAFYDAAGNLKPLDQVAGILQKSLEGMTAAQKQAALQILFGSDGIRAAALIAKAGTQGFDDLAGAMTNVTAASVASVRLDSMQGRLESLKGSLETVALTIGQRLTPGVSAFLDVLIRAVGGALPFIDNMSAKLSSFLEPLSTSMTTASNSIIPTMVEFGRSLVSTFQTQVLPAITQFAARIGPIFDAIRPAITTFVTTVLPALLSFAGFFYGSEAQAIMKFGSDFISMVGSQIMPQIQTFINTVMPLLQAFSSWFVATALPYIHQFVTELLAAWAQIEPELIGALQSIMTRAMTILTFIASFIQAHGDQIVAYFTLAWNTISGVIGPLLDAIKQIILIALNLIQGDWSGAWDAVKQLVIDVFEAILANFRPLIDGIKAVFSAFSTWIGGLFSAIGSTTQTAWSGIQNIISTVVNAISSAIHTVFDGIKAYLQPYWTAIQVIFDTVWRAIATIINVQMAIIRAVFDTVFPPLQAFIELTLNTISGIFTTVWDAISSKVSTVVNYIKDNIITPVFNAISLYITTTLTAIQTGWNTVWAAIQTTVSTIWAAIQLLITTAWNTISSILTTGWNTLSSTATTVWNNIKDALTKPIGDARDALGTIWDAIAKKAGDVWASIQKTLDDSKTAIKNALMWPFEQMRDGVEAVMKAAGNKLLSPLQAAVDGFKDFVEGVRGAINFVSGKLQLGDVIKDTWSGAKIRQLASGVSYWRGGIASIAESGTEAAKLPDGTVRMFSKPQLVDLPPGTKVFNAYATRQMVTAGGDSSVLSGINGTRPFYAAQLYSNPGLGRGGVFDGIKGIADKIGGLAGDALDYARGIAANGAEKVIGVAIDKLGIPKLPGVMSGFGGAGVKMVRDTAIKGIEELVKILKDNLPAVVSTPTGGTGGPVGPAGSINGVDGNTILAMAYKTSGVRNWCEKFVGDVFARVGARYARADDAYQHSLMQGTTPGTGPTGAPVYTGFNHPGDVAISMGNGMVYGTEGNGPLGAGPFSPYAGARFTLNPASRGLVVNGPTAILAGETVGARKEIVTPEALMASIFKNELDRSGVGSGAQSINIYVTANTPQEGYAAGVAAGRGFREQLLQRGHNS